MGWPERIGAARAELVRDGFTRVTGLFSSDDLAAVEAVLDRLVDTARETPDPSWRAIISSAVTNEPWHPEVHRPALRERTLQRSRVFLDCRRLAEQLLDAPAYYLFDHAIYKRPHGPTGVPWHQDQAYLGEVIPVRSLHFWIPLQDVDAESGCLRFARAGRTPEVRPHRSAYEQHPHVLRAEVSEPASVVEQPLSLGDVSVHTNLTLHSSGPNRSGTTRKAWIIHFGDRPRWLKQLLRLRARIARAVGARRAP